MSDLDRAERLLRVAVALVVVAWLAILAALALRVFG